MISFRRIAQPYALAATLIVLSMRLAASAQALSVLPVNVLLGPGERANTITVTNRGSSKTAIQIRAYAWKQEGDDDKLTPTDNLIVSPPIASIAPGESQVVRLILRQQTQLREMTYRILLDQIPPPAEPGIVHVVLRLSIPVFSQPFSQVRPQLQFHTEMKDGQLYLIGINDGLRHDALREIELSTSDGRKMKAENGSSPYVLPGATRHWKIDTQGFLPLPSDTLQLTAHSDAGAIKEQVRVVPAP